MNVPWHEAHWGSGTYDAPRVMRDKTRALHAGQRTISGLISALHYTAGDQLTVNDLRTTRVRIRSPHDKTTLDLWTTF